MDNKGYYKILGVDENASDDAIRKAYRAGAIKWHPDRWVNGTDEEKKTAEEKFKELNEAYSVLSDKQKRQAYDSGMDGQWQDMGGFNPFDIFKQHFGGKNPFGDFFGNVAWDAGDNFQSKPIFKGEDIDMNLELTMVEANSGVAKTISYYIHKKCGQCKGTGIGEGGGRETCPHCNGTGVIQKVQRMGYAQIVTQTTCPHCQGTGKIIKNPCPKCHGTGISDEMEKKEISLNIPIGISHGETLVVRGFGEYPPGGENEGVRGDLNIHISLKLPAGYSFKDNMAGIKYIMDIPFYDAILGCERDVLFPSGQTKKIKIKKGTKNGTVYTHQGEGMKGKDGRARSSFDVILNYTIPQKIDGKQEKLLKEFKNITENGD